MPQSIERQPGVVDVVSAVSRVGLLGVFEIDEEILGGGMTFGAPVFGAV